MALVSPFLKLQCPFCFHTFHPSDAPCRSLAPVLEGGQQQTPPDSAIGDFLHVTPPEMWPVEPLPADHLHQRLLRRLWLPNGHASDRKKVCPRCHLFLPHKLANGELDLPKICSNCSEDLDHPAVGRQRERHICLRRCAVQRQNDPDGRLPLAACPSNGPVAPAKSSVPQQARIKVTARICRTPGERRPAGEDSFGTPPAGIQCVAATSGKAGMSALSLRRGWRGIDGGNGHERPWTPPVRRWPGAGR